MEGFRLQLTEEHADPARVCVTEPHGEAGTDDSGLWFDCAGEKSRPSSVAPMRIELTELALEGSPPKVEETVEPRGELAEGEMDCGAVTVSSSARASGVGRSGIAIVSGGALPEAAQVPKQAH